MYEIAKRFYVFSGGRAECAAGVPWTGRPIFPKISHLGPEVTEQLAACNGS